MSDRQFFQNLKEAGMFVRDYDGVCVDRLPRVAKGLHSEICKLDLANVRTWEGVTLVEFVNAYAKAHEGLRVLSEEPG